MQKIIHSLIFVLFIFVVSFANEIQPLVLSTGEVIQPHHDGKHYFITNHFIVAQPSKNEIDGAISDAQAQGRIINLTSLGLDIPQALKEVSSLPVTFRNRIDGWNYDITVFAMTFTPQGSKLKIGCKFTLPNGTSLYFGANDIAASGKNGFVGELPILTSTLTDAKANEIDDPNNILGGETNFFEFSVPNFNDKLSMGLDKDTKLHFECGTFKKFTLSGFVKSYEVVERESTDGTALTDGKPLMLFFGKKDVYDWQDIYLEAQVSRAFHESRIPDLGFQFASNNKAILDFSKVQNPNSLPSCVNSEGWQGVYFPTFQVRLPKFFKLRSGVSLVTRTGKNLFIDRTGLVGNMTAENVYDLPEGYTDEVNNFDMSLDLLTASFLCNQTPQVSMIGRIQLGKCGNIKATKLLYYNFLYDKIRNAYSFMVKDSETGIYNTNKITLSSGSSITFGIAGENLILNTKLSKTPSISTTAYKNAVCSGYSTAFSISNCETGMFKWNTASGNANVSPLTITPTITTNQETITYQANCFDEYCINENSNAIPITVYKNLPALTLTSNKGVESPMCSYETADLQVSGDCPGVFQWITPENTAFQDDDVRTKSVNYPSLAALTRQHYEVVCNLSGCMSTDKPTIDIQIKKALQKPNLTTNQTDNKVCSGQSIEITGSCSNSSDTFTWIEGLASTDPNPYILTTDITKPQNKEYLYKASCSNDGCESKNEIIVNEYAIKKPNILVARNPIETGGLTEIVAFGCSRDSYVWSNGKPGIWDGQDGSIMRENLYEDRAFSVRCVMNGCASMPTDPVTVRVVSCEEAIPSPNIFPQKDNVEEGSKVTIIAGGCAGLKYEWSNGQETVELPGYGGTYIEVNPTATEGYSVRCKRDENCKSKWTAPAFIKTIPCSESISTPNIFPQKDNVVEGTNVTIIASGCSGLKYEWSTGQETNELPSYGGTYIEVSPNSTVGYRVRCKRDENCKSNWSVPAYIKTVPCSQSISTPSGIVSDNNDVAANTKVILFSGGCEFRYEWNDGMITDNYGGKIETFREVFPSTTTAYNVKCKKSEDCKSASTPDFTVRVKDSVPCTPAPSAPIISCSDKNIKSGEKTTISSSGCSGTIKWSDGREGNNIEVSSRGKYTATCTVSGCTSSASNEIEITLEDCTTPSAPIITVSKPSITKGEKVVVSGTCTTGTLEWKSPLNFLGGEVEPTTNTTYEAICKADTSCISDKGSATVTVSIIATTVKYNPPSITVSLISITKGQTVKVTATCETGSRVSWTAPSGFSGGDHKPDATTVYKAKCIKPYPIPENALEDSDESSKEVKVECPIVNAPILSSDKTEINADEKATITASGCVGGEIQWRDGSIGNQKIVGSGEYSALCKINDCYSKESNIIKIKIGCKKPNPPVISATKLVTYNDEKVVITATNCSGTTLWNDKSSGNKLDVNNGIYFAICEVNGCKSDFSNEITVTNKKYFTYPVTVKVKRIGFFSDYELTTTFYSKEELKSGVNFFDDIDCTSFQRFFEWWGDWVYNDVGTFVYGGITYSINVKTGYVFINTSR